MKMKIEDGNIGVLLRPFRVEEMAEALHGFTSMRVLKYTAQLYAATIENEKEWFDKTRTSPNDVLWAIVAYRLDQENDLDSLVPIGVTGLHDIDIHGGCTSGIIIWNTDWWHKGVASRAHLCRTLYAADYLNRFTISSQVHSYRNLE